MRRIVAVAAVVLGLVAIFWLRPTPAPSTKSPIPASPKIEPRPRPTVERTRVSTENLSQIASTSRARCRTDKDHMREWIDRLLDPAEPVHSRELAAFILGSLPDVEAQNALLKALEQGGDPAWIRTLILAIGSARDKGRDNSFQLPEGPWVKSTPGGLSVEIRTVLLDPATRSAVEKQLEHSDAEVRRAVVQVLQHTLLYEAKSRADGKDVNIGDVRAAFLKELDRDVEESVRAEAGRALAEWMSMAPENSSGFSDVVQSILRKAMEPEEDQVRFRTLPGLKQTEMAESDLGRVFDRAVKGSDFESRAWAIELASAHSEKLGDERQKQLMALAANDSDSKIRELALHQMPAHPQASELARHCLQDKEWNVRYAAVKALMRQGAQPETIEVLDRVARTDENEDVRAVAEEALKQLKK